MWQLGSRMDEQTRAHSHDEQACHVSGQLTVGTEKPGPRRFGDPRPQPRATCLRYRPRALAAVRAVPERPFVRLTGCHQSRQRR